MKKLLAVLFVSLFVSLPVKADPSMGVVVAVAVASGVAGKYSANLLAMKPNFNLTDACKAKTVQAAGGTYSYVTFEACDKS